ncbi:CD2 antigen cytoplasmic tail-binding protein 2, putative [Babesia caballi]|uniref:CD2 antigen cytoplasmic tail-binding protein 2, putative n=1 Tax=Babesia caballi TaxID=5871 RepID=A0AAV4LND3_BABCB|nr:CD2 antigen cytoplasmic tail-binding protein 2, putative [Babesia caballi]
MYLPHEINRIKDQRRLKKAGIQDDVGLIFGEDDAGYDVEAAAADRGDAEADNPVALEDGGVTIEPFNMRREMAEGGFDTAGMYLEKNRKMTSTNRSLNRDEGEDPWMASLTEQDALISKHSDDGFYRKRPRPPAESRPDLVQLLEGTPTVDVIKRLIALLEPGETPLDSLKPRSKKREKHVLPAFRRHQREAAGAQPEPGNQTDQAHEKRKSPTGLADMDVSDLAHVLTVTWLNVYYMTKEEIREALANAKKRPRRGAAAAPRRYQFRWVRGDGEVYGPSSEGELLSWIAHDYISDENPVELREVDHGGAPLNDSWVSFRDSELYNFLNSGRQAPVGDAVEGGKGSERTSGGGATGGADQDGGSSDGGDEDDGVFSKKPRKSELIGLKHKQKDVEEDSQASDDECDIE